MDNPLFSVLIANYNNERYLLETIDSIIKQTYKNWEIIIVDDGSTDSSKNIYTQLENNPQIKIFYNETNKGVGYTKGRCMDEAKGDICAFVDPDDAIVENALELMVQEHLKNPKAGLIYSEAYYCDENLKIIETDSIQRHRPVEAKSYLEEIEYIVGHFATFKREAYLKTQGLNPTYKRAVDQDLYYLLEEVSDLVYINKFLYIYRIHNKGVSSVGINTVKALSWNINVIIDACKRRNIEFDDIVAKKIIYHTGMPGQVNILQTQLDQINSSLSYKIGRTIAKLLYPIKRLIK